MLISLVNTAIASLLYGQVPNVSGIPITDFCELRGHKTNHNENEQALYEEVKNSAYEIIKKKGATYYGIALSVRRICESIVHDEHSILPVSSYHEERINYDLEDICMSVPAIVGSNGIQQVLKIRLDHNEQNALKASATELKSILDTLDL